MSANLYAILRERFPRDLARPFLETESGSLFKYADVEAETARIARYLADTGLQPGDRIAVQVDKSPQSVFLYLACLRGGYIFLPLNTAYKEKEIAYFLGDAEPGMVVVRPQDATAMRRLAASHNVSRVETLDALGGGTLVESSAVRAPDFEPVDVAPDDVAAILYTSGTTGRPKGAMITHRNLASNALTLHEYWGWNEHDVLLHALPIFHVHGLFVACHCVLLNGTRMLFLPRFDIDEVIRRLPDVTVMMGVPTYYTRLLAAPAFSAHACRNMRLFISGSAPLLEQTFEAFRERSGHTILERYGMTETGMNCSNPLDGERRPGTVGFPLPGVTARVVDDSDHVLEPGNAGNLQIKGDNVFRGYWRLPEKTAEELTRDGFFRTGDIARIGADGYVSIVGRAKDLVISGGYNVYPKEVELCIDALDGVVESAVIGLPHADFGEAVTAVVVRDPEARPFPGERVIDAVRENLAGYKVPKHVFFVDELPRNAMGKVQKNILRERFAESA